MRWSLFGMRRKNLHLYGYRWSQCPGREGGMGGRSGTLQTAERQEQRKKSHNEEQVRFPRTSIIRRLLQVVGVVRP